jgi:hypothetical protein
VSKDQNSLDVLFRACFGRRLLIKANMHKRECLFLIDSISDRRPLQQPQPLPSLVSRRCVFIDSPVPRLHLFFPRHPQKLSD